MRVRKRPSQAIPLGWGLAALSLGCSHVIHPAVVSPGLAVDVLPGRARVRHEPRPDAPVPEQRTFTPFSTTATLAQVTLTYGWRLSEDLALQLSLLLRSTFGSIPSRP